MTGVAYDEVIEQGSAFSFAIQSASSTEPYDIIVIGGQSNAVGWGCGSHTNVDTTHDGRIFQVNEALAIVPAKDPLQHSTPTVNGIGFGMTFARLCAARNPGRKVLIVPTAKSGTSILQWDNTVENLQFGPSSSMSSDSTELFDRLVRRTKLALATNTNSRLVAFLWHQGENDYGYMKLTASPLHARMPSVAAYAPKLREVIQLIRAQFPQGQSVPFLLGGIGDFWLTVNGEDPNRQMFSQFNTQLGEIAASTTSSRFVSAAGLGSGASLGCNVSPGAEPDRAHFSSPAQIELGQRYFAQFTEMSEGRHPLIMPHFVSARASIQDCRDLEPAAIRKLSEATIRWLATLQPSGLTLHETFVVARQTGFTGAFGQGEHNLFLAGNPGANAEFQSRVTATAPQSTPPYATFAEHHVQMRAAGYQGLWLCGGGNCFLEGRCDALGRLL